MEGNSGDRWLRQWLVEKLERHWNGLGTFGDTACHQQQKTQAEAGMAREIRGSELGIRCVLVSSPGSFHSQSTQGSLYLERTHPEAKLHPS